MRRFLFALAVPCSLFADDIPSLRDLSRTNLLEYKAADGTKKTAATAAEWAARRKEALDGFQQVAGPLPGSEMRCALDPQLMEEVDCGSYVRRLITYTSQPGGRVPAYLCIPKAALAGAKAPAVLCLHPTENTIGHKVVVGLGAVDFFGMPAATSTLRVYTVAGDLVWQTDHDGRAGDGQQRWNLISRNGQDVESGIYLFTVDSPLGHQVGRFVVIR